MAYVDNFLKLADAQALTASAVSENVIDLEDIRSVGSGEAMAVVFTVTTAADQTSSDEDYTFQVRIDSNTDMTTASQVIGQRIFESGTPTAPAQNADLLVAGYQFVIEIPPLTDDETMRYLGAYAILAGTTPTISVDIDVRPLSGVNQINTYANGYNIT